MPPSIIVDREEVRDAIPEVKRRCGALESGGCEPMSERLPPSLAEIEELARRALATIPCRLKRHLGAVVIRVEEFPDEETEAAMGLESPFDILGLYRGVALPHKSVSDPRPDLDMIFLYRRPLLDFWCESGEDLAHLVRHVLMHEIGHHFGFSDEDMARIEASD
jgi:predicted Zn-dependent protease with MMP-like domain